MPISVLRQPNTNDNVTRQPASGPSFNNKGKREDQLTNSRAVPPHPLEKMGLHVATQKEYLAHLAMCAQRLNQTAGEDEGRGLIRREDALDCLAKRHLNRSRRNRPDMELAQAREEIEHFLDYASDRTGLLIDKGGGQRSQRKVKAAFSHLSRRVARNR
jgi:hypothetical protein